MSRSVHRLRAGQGRAVRAMPLLCALLMAGLSACGDCGGSKRPLHVVATLDEVHGSPVERDDAAARERYRPAEVGDVFELGDGLRTGPSAHAVLHLRDGSRLSISPGTSVRFVVTGAASDEQAIDVRTGDAVLTSGHEEMRLRTHVGLAVLAAGSEVQLRRERGELWFRVQIGELRFNDAQGNAVAFRPGDAVRVGIGMAVLREAPVPADKPPVADPLPEPDAPGIVRAQEAVRRDDGLSYRNLSVPAGESFSVHAAEVPVAIEFEFGKRCDGDAELRAGALRTRGRGAASLSFSAGSRAYSLHCIDAAGRPKRGAAARGTVRVLRDSGSLRLPPRAPTSQIEADGRGYTVYYQNQLPDVRVRWPNAPVAARYQLEVDGKRVDIPAAEHTFRSGTLGEGTHALTFRGGERSSRTTTVQIKFDNAAPKAMLRAPADRGFSPGERVHIEGVALPTWKVGVAGGRIEKDDSDRFSGEVVTSAERPDVAVSLRHPRLGTHYYLRRAAGSR